MWIFGQKYGPINSIVLSRAGESDNVYIRDEESVQEDGLCEVKIVDNQIMNFNNRSDYLQGLLAALDGLYYYINDFNSTGILYYEVGDMYYVTIGENSYKCLMLNDEITVTTGIEERIYTDLPEQSQTDYSKADKTDRRINQTYLIVDKQNQTIESVVSSVSSQNTKISQITQTVDELNSKISDIADITKAGESTNGIVSLTEINASEPIMIKIRPNRRDDVTIISYIYPSDGIFPNDTGGGGRWYMPNRLIQFKRTYIEDEVTKTEYIYYEIPDDLLFYNSTYYDEFYLDYDSHTCQVTKRCKYDRFGYIVSATETVTDYPYPEILLQDGDYEISLISRDWTSGHGWNYLFVRLMAQNIYTTQFVTDAKLTSEIDQTARGLRIYVGEELSNYTTTNDMNTLIDITARGIKTEVSETYATKDTTNSLSSRIKQTAKSIELTTSDNGTSAGITIRVRNEDGTQIDSDSGNITLSGLVKFTDLSRSGSTTINGSNITTGTIDASQVTVKNINADKITSGTLSASKISGGTLNGDNMTVKNLKASSITAGTLNGIPIKNTSISGTSISGGSVSGSSISGGSVSGSSISNGSVTGAKYKYQADFECIAINRDQDGALEGYYTSNGSLTQSTRRYSIKAFNAGGKFQSFNSSGAMAAYFDQSGAHSSSDIRLKNNISNIEEQTSMEIINNLTPIEFTYKADETEYHRGLSAQEVEQVLKNNGIEKEIYEIRENGDYSLNYSELIPDLINCIKYLTKEIEELKGGK